MEGKIYLSIPSSHTARRLKEGLPLRGRNLWDSEETFTADEIIASVTAIDASDLFSGDDTPLMNLIQSILSSTSIFQPDPVLSIPRGEMDHQNDSGRR